MGCLQNVCFLYAGQDVVTNQFFIDKMEQEELDVQTAEVIMNVRKNV